MQLSQLGPSLIFVIKARGLEYYDDLALLVD
jgi:hypothetical protein